MVKIVIEQLNKDRETERIFTRHVHAHEVEQTLAEIYRAFNMNNTYVTVDGM
jgi:hypothetical protein